MKIFLSGSLRNPRVPLLGNRLRDEGFDVYDEWWGAGEIADDSWQKYEEIRGRPYIEALYGRVATNIYDLNLKQMIEADIALLLQPAGKSAALEFGYMRGQEKPGFLLLDRKKGVRWDLMVKIATAIFEEEDALIETLRQLL